MILHLGPKARKILSKPRASGDDPITFTAELKKAQ